jgi:AcrR family transcriptional regulator
METKKTTRKSGSQASSDRDQRIQKAYMEYLLTHGVRPVSVYKFCLDAGFTEQEFYDHFGSFEGLERAIWKGFIDKTTGRLRADESFSGFTAREKILAFYYTLLEELKGHRSFILLESHTLRRLELTPSFLKDFKTAFESFMQGILAEGKSQGEVATRPYLDKRYPQLFWMHLGLVLQFWKEDGSAGFEKTDAMIEKSVNLAFDLIGKGAVDSAIDFAKFMYQSKTN